MEWTEEKNKQLAKLFTKYNYEKLGEILGCSPHAVFRQGKKLGLDKKHFWTEDQLKYLKRYYGEKTRDEIAEQLGKTEASVGAMAGRLGLRKPAKQTKWTEEEIEFVDKNYSVMTSIQIAKKLGRSVSSVKTFIDRQSYVKKRGWTEEEINLVEKSYTRNGAQAIAKKLNRSIQSVYHRARDLNVYSVNYEKISLRLVLKTLLGKNINKEDYEKYKNNGLPFVTKRREKKDYHFVDMPKFWKWLEERKDEYTFIHFEKFDLGIEPKWVDIKRREDWRKVREERWHGCA